MSRTLPLADIHRDLGARFCPFAGYDMPLSYPLGVMREHQHTREQVGLFDISHMAHIEVMGPDAAALVSRACPYDAAAQEIGRGRYTLLLNERAGIIDDLIVSRLGGDHFVVIANAASADKDLAHLETLARSFDVDVVPLPRVFLALQGPMAAEMLQPHVPMIAAMAFMDVRETEGGWFVSRSGYTGEDGFEIALNEAAARQLVPARLADDRVQPVGLAARDSLRLEAGLPLYGQDMDESTDPRCTGLLWAIPKSLRESGDFVGAEALRTILSKDFAVKRVGLKPEGRAPVRSGAVLYDREDRRVGIVTSGGFGPTVGHPIAMGRVEAAHAEPDSQVFAEVRGQLLPVRIHPLPFTPHRYVKGR